MLNKRSFLRFVAWFFFVSVFLIISLGFIAENADEAVFLTAGFTSYFASLIGISSYSAKDMVFSNGMDLRIIPLCTGYISVSLITGFIMAFPSSLRKKLTGIMIFAPLAYAGTLVRLVTSFYVGNNYGSEAFTLFHDFLWQFGMMLLIVVFAFLWLHFIAGKKEVMKELKS